MCQRFPLPRSDAWIMEASTLKASLGVSAWSSAYWLGKVCPLMASLTIL